MGVSQKEFRVRDCRDMWLYRGHRGIMGILTGDYVGVALRKLLQCHSVHAGYHK